MKYFTILLLLLSISQVHAQGTSNFEVWGWGGEKKQFIENYKDSTGTDLNYGYTCVADLKKMGYNFSVSTIFLDGSTDLEKFRNGTLNWDSTERLAVVRQILQKKYAILCSEESDQIKESLFGLAERDSIQVSITLTSSDRLKEQVLIATLSDEIGVRKKSRELLEKYADCFTTVSIKNLEILAEMLSFPDPATTSIAMKLINRLELEQEVNSILFLHSALTLIDFLNSDLKAFRYDAIQFLTSRFPDEGEKSEIEWQELITSLN